MRVACRDLAVHVVPVERAVGGEGGDGTVDPVDPLEPVADDV